MVYIEITLTIKYINRRPMDNNTKERTVNINNFIGVYDNYITKEE